MFGSTKIFRASAELPSVQTGDKIKLLKSTFYDGLFETWMGEEVCF